MSSILIPGWNSKAILKYDEALRDWLQSKGAAPPCSKLPPEWKAIEEELRPGLTAEEVLSMVEKAKARIEADQKVDADETGTF